MHVTIRKIGNSHGIVIPKPMLLEAGLDDEAELTVEDGALVLRRGARSARQGWAARRPHRRLPKRTTTIVLGDLANDDDERLTW
jgi:antitoxin MazE